MISDLERGQLQREAKKLRDQLNTLAALYQSERATVTQLTLALVKIKGEAEKHCPYEDKTDAERAISFGMIMSVCSKTLGIEQ